MSYLPRSCKDTRSTVHGLGSQGFWGVCGCEYKCVRVSVKITASIRTGRCAGLGCASESECGRVSECEHENGRVRDKYESV